MRFKPFLMHLNQESSDILGRGRMVIWTDTFATNLFLHLRNKWSGLLFWDILSIIKWLIVIIIPVMINDVPISNSFTYFFIHLTLYKLYYILTSTKGVTERLSERKVSMTSYRRVNDLLRDENTPIKDKWPKSEVVLYVYIVLRQFRLSIVDLGEGTGRQKEHLRWTQTTGGKIGERSPLTGQSTHSTNQVRVVSFTKREWRLTNRLRTGIRPLYRLLWLSYVRSPEHP